LLHPQVVTPALTAYLERNGARATGYTIDLAWKLLSLGKTIGAPAETLSHLDDIWERLEEDRGDVLTQKNLVVIRAILMSDVWSKVCALPLQLMAKAQRMLNLAPKKALSLATIALQIQILTRAPVRIGNLLSIRLDYNLKRMGGTAGSYHLNFPDYDVKNRVDLNFELSGSTAAMIDQYINIFRPHLGEGHKGEWLFPGEDGKSRSKAHASAFIAATMEREVGLRVTAHQFRHAAAAVILKERVGDYEFVRRILGHLNIVTTMKFYTALEAFPASKVFGAIIEEQMARHPSLPKRMRTRRKTASNLSAGGGVLK
jgi:integrase